MIRKIFFLVLLSLLSGSSSFVGADGLDDKIRAAGTDIRVFCPATDVSHIQWAPLLYLNQTYGAEIHIALFRNSPAYQLRKSSSPDGQFHLARVGIGPEPDVNMLTDSVIASLFDGDYPDLAIFENGKDGASEWLPDLLENIQELSRNDSTAVSTLASIYRRVDDGRELSLVFNDAELFEKFREKAQSLSQTFDFAPPSAYKPERYRRYDLTDTDREKSGGDFIQRSGLSLFRLYGYIEKRLIEGPEKKTALKRLESYRSKIGVASQPWRSRSDKLDYLMEAYAEISGLEQMTQSGLSRLTDSSVIKSIRNLKRKNFMAIEEAAGIHWRGNLEIRETPFGETGKLTLDLDLTGPREIELSYFKFHTENGETVIIDSLSKVILPHQRFYREYPIDLSQIDFTEASGDSNLFSIEVIVRGLSLDLYVPFSAYDEENLSITFLPGYTFLKPFTEDQYTSLAQPFDWQLLVTKPYGSELDGRIIIDNPDGIVVGSFNDRIFMPRGVTARYFDIYFAAGRSIGYDLKKIGASLEVGGQVVAQTSAPVRIVRCEIPETRDIAFIPDKEGKLEDFLRISRVSFRPLTQRSLIRATLNAYDLMIVGESADDYYEIFERIQNRLNEYLRNGGDILILGQSVNWPFDIFEVPIYASKALSPPPPRVADKNHPLLNEPYTIDTDRLLNSFPAGVATYPAVVNGGREIISAGELGSYLRVVHINDGYVIYCGLPLLEMAAELNVEAIHLIANLLNFGHVE